MEMGVGVNILCEGEDVCRDVEWNAILYLLVDIDPLGRNAVLTIVDETSSVKYICVCVR